MKIMKSDEENAGLKVKSDEGSEELRTKSCSSAVCEVKM